jgi:tetratricopeptide (TPR) repeat protein
MTRIAIYTIAKNEAHNVAGFIESCQDADIVIVGDTGSDDGTQHMLQQRGAIVVPLHIEPWRFDVARNTVLSLVPPEFEVCFALDLDERLQKGWREAIEPCWDTDYHNRLWFKYIHSFNSAGAAESVGTKGFAHSRNGYVWKHRVHEDIYWQGNPADEHPLRLPAVVVEHRQAAKKSRDTYLSLLQDECASETVTQRHVFWLCRELFYRKSWKSVLAACQKLLSYSDLWHVERAHGLYMQAAAFEATGTRQDALQAHMRGCDAAPKEREPWFEFGRFYYKQKQWAQAYGLFVQCLEITHRGDHYLTSATAWGPWPHYMAAVCMHKLGGYAAAARHIVAAAAYDATAPHIKALLEELQPYVGESNSVKKI